MMPFCLFLHFSVVSSVPVEIVIDPHQLTPPSSQSPPCPSGQWLCPNVGMDKQNGGNGEGWEEKENENNGECISEHSACNGKCPTPAIW